MRILFDECMPYPLRRDLPGHFIATVTGLGWQGTKNGALLRRAAPEFDVLITIDQNMEYQQNLHGLDLAVMVLTVTDKRLSRLRLLAPQILGALQTIRSGEVIHVGFTNVAEGS